MKNIFYEILPGNQIKHIVFGNCLPFEICQLSQKSRTKISFENRCSKIGTFPLPPYKEENRVRNTLE
jgi:hypothetical protein